MHRSIAAMAAGASLANSAAAAALFHVSKRQRAHAQQVRRCAELLAQRPNSLRREDYPSRQTWRRAKRGQAA